MAVLVVILFYLQSLQQAVAEEAQNLLTAMQDALEVRAAEQQDQVQAQAEQETLADILQSKVMQVELHLVTAQVRVAEELSQLVLVRHKTLAVMVETA
jgi:hypothetical protein